ncbi:MAG TPA: MogA/MoaB family molybdenum cofactor biosynthesis protein [Armatimonadota bacterium]|jgi:molybdenum cofactor synthesis domain-containing protein
MATEAGPIRVGILTSSDAGYAGQREDTSGPAIREALGEGYVVSRAALAPDDEEMLVATLGDWLPDCDVILTTGGTGLASRDVTPEATLRVLEREAPGIAEVLRAEGRAKTPFAALSRGVAGIAGRTLIVNLPGSPKAVREGMQVLLPLLPHAVRLLRGDTAHEPG